MSTPRPRRARDPRRRQQRPTAARDTRSTVGHTAGPSTTRADSSDRPGVPSGPATDVSPDAGKGFAALGVPAPIVRTLVEMDRANPFPVQSLTLADSLSGADVCVKAPTGSGKTLAFAIPVALRTRRSGDGRPRALILLPTRELAGQVAETLLPLARTQRLRVATVYGGTSVNRDLSRMRQGVDVVVATPGRLADLVERRAVDLSSVEVVVLDEADRMADMGFMPEVVRLLDRTSDARQTLLFSATLDGDVDKLIRRYQNDPVRHTLLEEPSAAGDVRHLFWGADRGARRRITGDLLRTLDPAIVFTRTKHGADRLVKQLRQDGIAAAAIHGDRSQNQRERALASFRTGEVATLVATDVAARGIHVDDVAIVIHYDLAGSDKDYQHRSGRTGRAGASGVVVSLVDPSQHAETAAIQRSLALPEGLHDLDIAQVTAEHAPDVTLQFSRPRQEQPRSKPKRRRGTTSGAPYRSGGRSGARSRRAA